MPTYTIFEPPLRKDETAPDPERFAFVRDGFRFWAFVLGPLWLIGRRLWLALIGYLVVAALLTTGTSLLTGSSDATLFVTLVIAVLFGLEASSLHRWTLRRRGWRELGTIVADDLDSAERRFFADWVRTPAARPVPPAGTLPAAVPARPPVQPGIIGLFPESGTTR